MKLGAFDALCEREWERNHGDISVLRLTDESAEELERDMVMDRDYFSRLSVLCVNTIQAAGEGTLFTYVFNPITRTAVKIERGCDKDEAKVHYVVPCDRWETKEDKTLWARLSPA